MGRRTAQTPGGRGGLASISQWGILGAGTRPIRGGDLGVERAKSPGSSGGSQRRTHKRYFGREAVELSPRPRRSSLEIPPVESIVRSGERSTANGVGCGMTQARGFGLPVKKPGLSPGFFIPTAYRNRRYRNPDFEGFHSSFTQGRFPKS